MEATKLLAIYRQPQFVRYLNCYTAAITRTHRNVYVRTYPTALVLPNGASITIPYAEPRKIIRLPLDIATLSEAERKARIDSRKPKQKITVKDDFKNTFNAKKYLKYVKK